MDDPLSPLTSAPPRYLLESDSSDEEGHGLYPSSSSPRASRQAQYEVSFTSVSPGSSGSIQSEEVIIGVGQAGRYLARKAGLRNAKPDILLQVKSNGRTLTAGEGWRVSSDVFLLRLNEGDDHSLVWKTAQVVADRLSAKQWTLVSFYVPSMYIPDPEHPVPIDQAAPIRSLPVVSPGANLKEERIANWQNPNYLTGISAALASLATHPARKWSSPLSILNLPLPLSSLSTSATLAALQSSSPMFAQYLKDSQKSQSQTSWTEADDEPFSGPGMGAGKNLSSNRGEAGTMYT